MISSSLSSSTSFSIKSLLITSLIAASSSLVSSQSQQSNQTVPFDKIFSPQELQLIESSHPIAITPLLFEQKSTQSWFQGFQDIQKVLTLQNVDIQQLQGMNENTTLVLQGEQLKAQVEQSYGLGVLHFMNQVAKQVGLEIPPIKQASEQQIEMQHFVVDEMKQYMTLSKQQQQRMPFVKFIQSQMKMKKGMGIKSIKHDKTMSKEEMKHQDQKQHESKQVQGQSQSESQSESEEENGFSTNGLGFGFGGFGFPGFGFGWGFPGFGIGIYRPFGFGW